VIVSFRDAETKRIFEGRSSKKLPLNIQRTARRKLLSLAASVNLADLGALPGNRFERLKDDRKGQYSASASVASRDAYSFPRHEVSSPLRGRRMISARSKSTKNTGMRNSLANLQASTIESPGTTGRK
jgi:proteic killer suppression protein